jgi:integrase
MLDRTAAQLSNEYSLKVGTIKDYQGIMRAMEKTLSKPPPYTPLEVRRYLTQLYLKKAGRTTPNKVRVALDWWHQVNDCPPPCNPSVTRLCDSMLRELPKIGNPARRPLDDPETKTLLDLASSRIIRPGDHWDRNVTVLALALTTALRIQDMLRLRYSDLAWKYQPLRLTMWLTDSKKDRLSEGKFSAEFTQDINNNSDGIGKLWYFTQINKDKPTTDYIFKSTMYDTHISYDSMRSVLIGLAETAGLRDLSLVGWHSCRKTRADLEMTHTGDISKVRHILDHTKKSSSTKFYLTHPPSTKR